MVASHLEAPLIDSREVGALGELETAVGVLDRLMMEGYISSTSSTPTLIADSVLW